MCLKPTVYVHIGLPKTATTTLQRDLFPSLQNSQLEYAGIQQPRSAKQRLVYERFAAAVNGQGSVEQVRAELAARLIDSRSLLISEEMVVVSDASRTWRAKLDRLGNVLRGLEHRIIVTTREPTQAMFSYYVERYPWFSQTCQSFLNLAIGHESMEIYHYRKLVAELDRHFAPANINFFAFEDIVEGRTEALIALLQRPGSVKTGVRFGHHNARKKNECAIYRQRRQSLRAVLGRQLRRLGISAQSLPRFLTRVVRPVQGALNVVPWRTTDLITRPSAEEMEQLRSDLAEETKALRAWGLRF